MSEGINASFTTAKFLLFWALAVAQEEEDHHNSLHPDLKKVFYTFFFFPNETTVKSVFYGVRFTTKMPPINSVRVE